MLTKIFIEIQGNMLNAFGTHCFTKWCGGLMVETLVWSNGDQSSILLINI
jgi:hypothetical protein